MNPIQLTSAIYYNTYAHCRLIRSVPDARLQDAARV